VLFLLVYCSLWPTPCGKFWSEALWSGIVIRLESSASSQGESMDELVVKRERDVCYSSLSHEIEAFVLKEDLVVERLQLLIWKVLR